MGEITVIRSNGKVDPDPFRKPRGLSDKILAAFTTAVAVAFCVLLGYVVWNFVILDKPTARQRHERGQAAQIQQLRRDVRDLQLRVDSLSLQLYERPPTTTR